MCSVDGVGPCFAVYDHAALWRSDRRRGSGAMAGRDTGCPAFTRRLPRIHGPPALTDAVAIGQSPPPHSTPLQNMAWNNIFHLSS
ncbi:hypothetical protein SKAU_G00331870 [Synaphobranchus kaupii]|uniref:Uncharacterized protein n=1 Tax=Synaphobranchus kaupii TaxID=118154 RepID=A0A9Q1ELA2_SYNKA|nr:hypothetical protein SKAU_G00331870 [Synaphobranchus kaupii]